MVSSTANTVSAYLAQLPPERRQVVSAVRDVVLANLPDGYEEVLNWGMITYEVPLSRYPKTYNKKPLMYAALAAQKNHYALYLSAVYQDAARRYEFQEGFQAAGKKLDMGKSCVRFRKLENLPLDVVAKVIADVPVDRFIAEYEEARSSYVKKA
ncbi:MAG: DUF1801 domain-containing protein [Anaerolineaceae bacterium]|nr:DUF1801 domain-containing protein [Anaerolineaceae bacterium]